MKFKIIGKLNANAYVSSSHLPAEVVAYLAKEGTHTWIPGSEKRQA
jgi:hypothetical protein